MKGTTDTTTRMMHGRAKSGAAEDCLTHDVARGLPHDVTNCEREGARNRRPSASRGFCERFPHLVRGYCPPSGAGPWPPPPAIFPWSDAKEDLETCDETAASCEGLR